MAEPAPRPGPLQRLTGEAWTFDPHGALVRVPAIVAALAAGVAAGRPLSGVLAAGGALSVGFGAALHLGGSGDLLRFATAFAVCASAFAGSLAGGTTGGAAVVAALFGGACGLASSRRPGVAWMALQCGIAGVIATSYDATPRAAAERAAALVAGGLAQASVLALTRPATSQEEPPERTPAGHALRLALALGVATALERALALRNGYWVPMTALLVLRPGAGQTLSRAAARTAGTLAGVAVATSLAIALHPGRLALALLVGAFAFGAYLFQKATYGLLSACVSGYAVMLLAFAGSPERQVALARVTATLLGAAIGLAVQLAQASWAAARRLSGRRSPTRSTGCPPGS